MIGIILASSAGLLPKIRRAFAVRPTTLPSTTVRICASSGNPKSFAFATNASNTVVLGACDANSYASARVGISVALFE